MRKHLSILTALLTLAAPCAAQSEQPLPEQPGAATNLGYKTVAEALAAFRQRPGAIVEVTGPERWTIVTLPAPEYAIWSFTPEGHYAHPAVVRRTVKQANGMVYVEMSALCQAAKEPCDRLMREFQQLNQRMRDEVGAPAAPDKGK
jgi:hypothetical protein